MTRRLIALIALALMVPLPAAAQEAGELPGGCAVDDASTVSVLLLIDQSGSLRRTDPDDQRIRGAQAVVASYALLAERVAEVEVQVAGFGEEYRPGVWTALDASSLSAVQQTVDDVASVTSQRHTDYVYALAGAVESLADTTSDCRILFWFTDGEHDLDPGFLAGGLDRRYFDQPVTVENVAEAEALMPALICDPGGYADRLGEAGVSSEIMLLGDETDIPPASRRVLRGMGGDPAFDCGPGKGSFQSAGDAERLPFIMACAAQVGGFPLRVEPDGAGNVLITDQTVDAGPVPNALTTEVRLIARGSGSTPTMSSSLDEVGEEDVGSATSMVVAGTDGGPFTLESSGVEEACAFVIASAAEPVIQSLAPTIYQGEPAEFRVMADGPHGRLEGEVLDRLQVEAVDATVGPPDGSGWEVSIPSLPSSSSFELTVGIVSAPGLARSVTMTFPVSEPLDAPAILSQPAPLRGEGTGPFQVELTVDPRDGGQICLLDPNQAITDSQGDAIGVVADLSGSECVELEPGGLQTVTLGLTLDRPGFAQQTLALHTRSIPASTPDRSEEGTLSLDVEVTPRAQPGLVAAVTAGLMLLMLGALWAIAYGVNRLIARIPDPRRHRVRYVDFVAEMSPTPYGGLEMNLVEPPRDGGLRIPRRTPGRLEAGRLDIERVVSAVPWVAPHAIVGMGTDLVASHQGPGLPGITQVAERTYRSRSTAALGPLVAIGLTRSQLEGLEEGAVQKVPGVLLFGVAEARGADVTRFGAEIINGSLELIGAEISTRLVADNMERTGEI